MYPMMGGMGAAHGRDMPMQGSEGLIKEIEALDEVLYLDPIPAYRAWFVVEIPHRGFFLRSISHPIPWPHRRPMIAHCLPQLKGQVVALHNHTCPNLRHRCGIYGCHDQAAAREWAGYVSKPHWGQAIGQIRFWGHVMRFTKGFLGEYAYPTNIILRRATFPEYWDIDQVSFDLQANYGRNISIQDWEEPEK